MKKGRVILAVVVGLLILAVVVFYLKIGGLMLGREDFDKKRMGYCFDVATEQTGSRLFVAAGKRGLHIFDLAQGELRYLSTYYDGGYYRNLKVWEDRAYIADSKRAHTKLGGVSQVKTSEVSVRPFSSSKTAPTGASGRARHRVNLRGLSLP